MEMRIGFTRHYALAILIVTTGFAAATHTAASASNALPACDKTLLEFNHPSTNSPTTAHIPTTGTGSMRFCRYRWDSATNKLALSFDDEESKAPPALLKALTNLKTKNEVYGPNYAIPCPWMHGNADLVILRGAGSKLTFIKVQQEGCLWVFVTHPGSNAYVTYVSTAELMARLNAITPTGGRGTTRVLKIQVKPSTNLRDGEKVLVHVSGGAPGERFYISECATASATNSSGCGDQMALEPFIDTDPSGSGSTMIGVHTKAATKPYNAKDFQTCATKCVVMATGTDISGNSAVTYAPVRFHP